MTDEQTAFAILVNCLTSVGVDTGMNDQFNRDLWRAAELMGISRLDLLKSVNAADSVLGRQGNTENER